MCRSPTRLTMLILQCGFWVSKVVVKRGSLGAKTHPLAFRLSNIERSSPDYCQTKCKIQGGTKRSAFGGASGIKWLRPQLSCARVEPCDRPAKGIRQVGQRNGRSIPLATDVGGGTRDGVRHFARYKEKGVSNLVALIGTWPTAKALRPIEIDAAMDLTTDSRAFGFAPRS